MSTCNFVVDAIETYNQTLLKSVHSVLKWGKKSLHVKINSTSQN